MGTKEKRFDRGFGDRWPSPLSAETFNDRLKPKWWLVLVLVGIGLAVLLSYPSLEHRREVWRMPLVGQVIVLDPGHGGQDPGAVSRSGVVEKKVALNIALKLRDYLQQSGAYVVMTRETDRDLADEETRGTRKRKVEDLKRRVQLIKDNAPNFVVSIHLNSIGSSRWYGAQTFYHPAFEESQKIADLIQHQLIQDLGNTTRVAKQASNIYLLKSIPVPAVLVEVGFLSNPREAGLLGQEGYQDKLAASIYKGILAYFADATSEKESAQ